MAKYLTKHFTLEEMITTQVRSVKNIPSVKEIENLIRTCQDGMEPIREEFGPIHVNSGFRSEGVNKATSAPSDTAATLKD